MVGRPSGGGGGGSSAASIDEMIRVRRRLNLIEQVSPDFAALNPEAATSLAMGYQPDPDLVNGIMGAIGVTGVESMIEDLKSADPAYARAQFRAMPEAQQNALIANGYTPPGDEGGGGGFLGSLMSAIEVPFTTQIKRGFQALTPFETTGGNIRLEVPDVAGPLDEIATGLATVAGQPARLIGNTVGGALTGMDMAWRLTTRIQRTGYEMAASMEERGIAGAGGLGGFSFLGGLVRGVNPANWDEMRRAWHEVEDGEEYHTRESRIKASKQLEAVPGWDLSELMTIASKRSAGHTIDEIIEQVYEDIQPDTPEWDEKVMAIYSLDGDQNYVDAVSTLDGGNVSFGRETARGMGLTPNSPLWNPVSGLGDALNMVFMDPTNLLGGSIVKGRKLYGMAARTSDQASMDMLARIGRAVRAHDEMGSATTRANARNDILSFIRHRSRRRAGISDRIARNDDQRRVLSEKISAALQDRHEGLVGALRVRRTWQQARAVNAWVDLTANAMRHADIAEDALRRGDMAAHDEALRVVSDYFEQSPTSMAAWDTMREHHAKLRGMLKEGETIGGMGGPVDRLDTFDGVWDYLVKEEGVRTVTNTPLGGFMQEYRPLPRVAPANERALRDMPSHIGLKAKELMKRKFTEFMDPSGGAESAFRLDEMRDFYNEVSLAVREAGETGEAIELPEGMFDEVYNWMDKTPNRPVRNFIRSAFYHQPHSDILNATDAEAITEFRRMVDAGGALSHMPRNLRDEFIGRFAVAPEAERYLLLEQFLTDFFVRSGIISHTDEAGQQLLSRYIGRMRQSYSLTDLDQLTWNGQRTVGTLTPDAPEMSSLFAMPNFKELAIAARNINRHRRLFGYLNPRHIDAFVTRAWAPAQLLRPGFIIRASGEMLIHYALRRGPGEYLQSRAMMKSLGMRKVRQRGLVATDLDALARARRIPAEQLTKQGFKEFHELTMLRPLLWFGWQMGEWSRLIGKGYEAEVMVRAAQLAERGGKKVWDNMDEVARAPFIEEAQRVVRQGKRIRSALVDTYEAAERWSLKRGGALHELAQRRGFMTKREIYETISKRFARFAPNDPMAQLFDDEHDLGTHVAHLMLSDGIIARAIQEQQGVFQPWLERTGDVTRGMLDENFQAFAGAAPKSRYVEVRIDPSNFVPYTRADMDEFMLNYASLLERSKESPSMMAAIEQLHQYVAPQQMDSLRIFFTGTLGGDHRVVSMLNNPADGGLGGLLEARRLLEESGAIYPLRRYLRDPTESAERDLYQAIKKVRSYVDEELVHYESVPRYETISEPVDVLLDEDVIHEIQTFAHGGDVWATEPFEMAEGINDLAYWHQDNDAFLPFIDPDTGQPMLDPYGKPVMSPDPDPEAGQWREGYDPGAVDGAFLDEDWDGFLYHVTGAGDNIRNEGMRGAGEVGSQHGLGNQWSDRQNPDDLISTTPDYDGFARPWSQMQGMLWDIGAGRYEAPTAMQGELLDFLIENLRVAVGDDALTYRQVYDRWLALQPLNKDYTPPPSAFESLTQMPELDGGFIPDVIARTPGFKPSEWLKYMDDEGMAFDLVGRDIDELAELFVTKGDTEALADLVRVVRENLDTVQEELEYKAFQHLVRFGGEFAEDVPDNTWEAVTAAMGQARAQLESVLDRYLDEVSQRPFDPFNDEWVDIVGQYDIWDTVSDAGRAETQNDIVSALNNLPRSWNADSSATIFGNSDRGPAVAGAWGTADLFPFEDVGVEPPQNYQNWFVGEGRSRLRYDPATDPRPELVRVRVRKGAKAEVFGDGERVYEVKVRADDSVAIFTDQIKRDVVDTQIRERSVLVGEDQVPHIQRNRREVWDDTEVRSLVDAIVHNAGQLSNRDLELLTGRELVNPTMSWNQARRRAAEASRRKLYDWTNPEALRSSAHRAAEAGSQMAVPLKPGHTRLYMPTYDRRQQQAISILSNPQLDKNARQAFTAKLSERINDIAEELGVHPGALYRHLTANQSSNLTQLADMQRALKTDQLAWGIATGDPALARRLGGALGDALDDWVDTVGPSLGGALDSAATPLSRRRGLSFIDVADEQLYESGRRRARWGNPAESASGLTVTGPEALPEPTPWDVQGITRVEDSDFFHIHPRRQIDAMNISDDGAQWMHTVRVVSDEGTEHILTATPDELRRLQSGQEMGELREVEVLSDFYGSGVTEELAVQQLVEKQLEETLNRVSTMRNGNVPRDEVMHEITGAMLRDTPISDQWLIENGVMDDMPQHVYGPSILKPSELALGKFVDALKGISRHGFDDVITPAINAIMYHPQMHASMVESYRNAMPAFMLSEPYTELQKMIPGDMQTFHRLIEHDLVAHPEGVVGAVKGYEMVPLTDPDDVAERFQDLAQALAKDSPVSDVEYLARWTDYAADGKRTRVVYEDGTFEDLTGGDQLRDKVRNLRNWIADAKKEAGKGPLPQQAKEWQDQLRAIEGTARKQRGLMRRANVEYGEMRQSMIEGAFARFTPYIDDHRIRSQFQSHVGGLIPFWFAEEQFMKRWVRGLYETPQSLRRGQIAMNGLRNMGFIETDEYGNEVFVYPGGEQFMEAIAPLAGPLFGGTGLGDITTGTLSTNTSFMFPGLNDSPGQFAYGPWAAIMANSVVEMFPEFSDARDRMLGEMGANRWDPSPNKGTADAIFNTFMPSGVTRLVRSITRNVDNEQLMSAQMQALQVMAATEGLPDERYASAKEIDDFTHRARNMARTILGIRGLTSVFAGSTANPELEGVQFTGDFQELLEAGLDYPDALMALQERYAEDGFIKEVTPFTVFTTESSSGAPIPATEEALTYMQDNGSFLSAFPDLAPWLLPQGEDASYGVKQRRARATALADGLRMLRSPDEYVRAMYVAEAAEDYFAINEEYQLEIYGLSQSPELKRIVQEEYRTWKSNYLAMHPTFAEEISTREGAARRERVVEQAKLLIADWDNVPSSNMKGSMYTMLQALLAFDDQMQGLKYINIDRATELRAFYRREFYNAATAAAMEFPELSAFVNSVVRPMIGSEDVALYEAGVA